MSIRRKEARRTVASLAFFLAALSQHCIALYVPPPVFTVAKSVGSLSDGYVFITPAKGAAVPTAINGPEILDKQGRPVWFMPLAGSGLASDLRVQTYQGQPVLTWSQGTGFENLMPGGTTDYIADNSYKVIASVQAGNGLDADQHEFQLTSDNTALITIYNIVQGDLTSVGGPASAPIIEGVVQEVDVATGQILLEWHSLSAVAVGESYAGTPVAGSPYDYFHINSINVDSDGNLLVSARHTWTVYKINRSTGAVMWRLGGKKSDFTLGSGLPFAWQHNAVPVDSQTIRIFDNESNGTPVLPYSRVIWVTRDESTMTASVTRSIQHPDNIQALAEGNSQALANGDTFVEWGILGRVSEFDPSGALILDATEPSGVGSYRGYSFPWTGAPTTNPHVTALLNGDGTATVHAIWNGATNVASWNVFSTGPSGIASIVASGPWNGLDTAFTIPGTDQNLQVVALDASGATIAQSALLTGTLSSSVPDIVIQPVPQTVAEGSTAVLSVSATGPNLTYKWYLNGTALSDGASSGTTTAGSNSDSLVITSASAASTGTYLCVVANSGGTLKSSPATLAVVQTPDQGRITDISSRAAVGTGQGALIAGFTVGGGSGSEPVLIRASGPALSSFGVAGTLPDPQITLAESGVATPLAVNAGWDGSQTVSNLALTSGAFAWSNLTSLDAALTETLSSGGYSMIVTGAAGDTGVALAEVYDATPAGLFTPGSAHLTNISARAQVGTGSNILIVGLTVTGSTSRTVLIRASGPALAQFGISGILPDPQLSLYSVGSPAKLIAANAGWGGGAVLASAASSVGAFTWADPASADSAMLVTLAPGSYTAQVAGLSGDSGIALVEVYEVQ